MRISVMMACLSVCFAAPGISMLGNAVSAALPAEASKPPECTGTPAEIGECLEKQIETEKATLNHLYSAASAKLPDEDQTDRRRSRSQLVRAQSAWMAYVTANCAYVGGIEGGSNSWVSVFQATCVRDAYLRRIEFFEHPPSQAATQPADPNRFPVFPDLGRYADTLAQTCGRKKVVIDAAKIPDIGCFAIRAGSSLNGQVDGRAVTIRVAPNGEESFEVDGIGIRRTGSSTTNDQWVKPSSSGFAFCRKERSVECPVLIETMDRQAGRFAVFDVARAFKAQSYVTNEENWNAETGH